MKPLKRDFYAIEPTELAVKLLGKVLVGPRGSGRIVETEAYWGKNDPASHGNRGPTPRNLVMFGPPGHLYVYFTYGMHYCANVVAGADGECAAVLLRALVPMEGVEEMKRVRLKAKKMEDLCNGPAKLTQALGIGKDQNGIDLTHSFAPTKSGTTKSGQRSASKPSKGKAKPIYIYDDGFKLKSVSSQQVKKTAAKKISKQEAESLKRGYGVSPRIGVHNGADLLWRYFIPGDPHLSRR